MRKFLQLLGILAVSLVSLTSLASAQPAPVYNWTGFYVGVNTGAGWAHTGWSDPFGPPFDMGSDRGTGWQFGGQAGVNYQAGMWVFGIEGHLASLRIDSSHFDPLDPLDDLRTRIDSTAHVAGRLGIAWDRWMVYVLGGPAWMRGHHEVIDLGVLERDARVSRSGWMFGVGGAMAVDPRFRVFLEYNYFDFGTEQVTLVDIAPPFATVPVDIRQNAHVVKIGVNVLFNPFGAPPP